MKKFYRGQRLTKGLLIAKEKAGSNYRLVFENQLSKAKGHLNLFLHFSQEVIFLKLQTGKRYFFSWFKGRNFYFIKPLSIREYSKESFRPVSEFNENNFFLLELSKKVQVKNLIQSNIEQKLKQLRDKRLKTDVWKEEEFLQLIKEAVILLFLNRELLPFHHQQGFMAHDLLQELEYIFYQKNTLL